MIKRNTTEELMEEVRRLGEGERRRVLEYARSLSRPKGIPGTRLLEHAGGWSDDVADEIAAAIEEGCEQVNLDAW